MNKLPTPPSNPPTPRDSGLAIYRHGFSDYPTDTDTKGQTGPIYSQAEEEDGSGAILFNPRLGSTELVSRLTPIFDLDYHHLLPGRRRSFRRGVARAIQSILRNVILTSDKAARWGLGWGNLELAIPAGNSFYRSSNWRRRTKRPFGHVHVAKAIQLLTETRVIEIKQQATFSSAVVSRKGRARTYQPTAYFKEIFFAAKDSKNLAVDAYTWEPSPTPDHGVFILRGPKDKYGVKPVLENAKVPEELKSAEKVVREYNKQSSAHSFELRGPESILRMYSDASEVEPGSNAWSFKIPGEWLTTTRVFSEGSWEYGGRYHSDVQSQIISPHRAHLWVNNEPMVELDFRAMHPSICYHRLGLEVPEDCYSLGAADDLRFPRELRKLVLLIMLNKKNGIRQIGEAVLGVARIGTKGSLHETTQKAKARLAYLHATNAPTANIHEVEAKLTKLREIRSAAANHPKLIEECAIAFERRHAAIKQFFCKASWKTLFRIESDIAARIIAEFTARRWPLIAIHDGFLCCESHQFILRDLMISAYKDVVGTKYIPRID